MPIVKSFKIYDNRVFLIEFCELCRNLKLRYRPRSAGFLRTDAASSDRFQCKLFHTKAYEVCSLFECKSIGVQYISN